MVTRVLQFAPNSFFQVFVANLVPWDVKNKGMSFCSPNNYIFGLHTRYNILKILWEAKKYFQSCCYFGGLKDVPL